MTHTKLGAVVTNPVYPPIPIRSFDWCAFVEDSDEETRIYGWGPTREKAIRELKAALDVDAENARGWPRRCKGGTLDHNGECWHCCALNGENCRGDGDTP